MRLMPKPDDFDKAEEQEYFRRKKTRKIPLSMFEAVAFYQGKDTGFSIGDIKRLTGSLWDQSLWDWMAKESFDLQKSNLPVFNKNIGKWVYCP